MKNIILIIHFFIFPSILFSQADRNMIVINFKDSMDLSHIQYLKEIKIKTPIWPKKYTQLVKQAIDSLYREKGNCMRVVYHNQNFIFGKRKDTSIVFKAILYKIHPDYKEQVTTRIIEMRDSIYRTKSFIQKISHQHPIKVKHELSAKETLKEIFKGLPKDSISLSRLEVGMGLGMDYIILANIHISTDIFLVNSKSFRLSLNNKAGLMTTFVHILYDYPSLKLHTRISKHWITISTGQEFTHVYHQGGNYKRTIDYRIDLGIKMYKSDNTSTEISIPFRFDDEVPLYLTGINVVYNFGIKKHNTFDYLKNLKH